MQQKNRSQQSGPLCSASFPCPRCPAVPFEGLVKVTVCSVGMVAEFLTALDGGHFVSMGNSHHLAIYFFFTINGLADMAAHRGTAWVPAGSDYVSLALAFFVQGVLFVFHLHGRVPIDVRVHQLHILLTFMTLAAILVEMSNRDQVLAILFRSLCTLTLGTWLMHVGFILYSPLPGAVKWADHDHVQLMLVTAIFTAHIAVNLVFIAVAGFLTHMMVKNRNQNGDYNAVYRELSQEMS
ncbi:Transmembrane protein 45B [Halotydeus destructor]|nr:Transmembrane protein 45B [Halotydeus destructor]